MKSILSIQADLFHKTILKIESDNISAYDVAYQLDLLKGNIMLRRDEKYIDPMTEEEMNIVINSSGQDEVAMNAIFAKFYGMFLITFII